MLAQDEDSSLDGVGQEETPPLMLREEAFIALERMIVTGQLAPGEWVSETRLIEASGHSRASVRSAVQRLQDQQLIKTFPRRGAQICPIDYTTQFRAQELRRVVEGLLARCAAQRANQIQRSRLREIALAFPAAASRNDQAAMTELDLENYSLILKAADNPFASKAMVSVKGLSRRFWILNREEHGDIVQMAAGHAAIASAIADADPVAAEQAVGRMVDYVEKFTLKVVGYNAGS